MVQRSTINFTVKIPHLKNLQLLFLQHKTSTCLDKSSCRVHQQISSQLCDVLLHWWLPYCKQRPKLDRSCILIRYCWRRVCSDQSWTPREIHWPSPLWVELENVFCSGGFVIVFKHRSMCQVYSCKSRFLIQIEFAGKGENCVLCPMHFNLSGDLSSDKIKGFMVFTQICDVFRPGVDLLTTRLWVCKPRHGKI